MRGHGRLKGSKSNLFITYTFYPLNTFSNLHASRLLVSTVVDDVLRLAGQPRARRRRPRPDGIPPGRELRQPLLVCS
jgi:hypothetical protein